MTYLLFTVTVTALDGSIGLLDPDKVLTALVEVLALSDILDAAVTADSDGISFTGQVKSTSAIAAVKSATAAMFTAGYHDITTIEVNPCKEEYGYDTFKVAVA